MIGGDVGIEAPARCGCVVAVASRTPNAAPSATSRRPIPSSASRVTRRRGSGWTLTGAGLARLPCAVAPTATCVPLIY